MVAQSQTLSLTLPRGANPLLTKELISRWDGDSPRLLDEGQAVPRGVREPRDGEDGEDHRDVLLLQLLLL